MKPCDCYYGEDCTKTTVCANESIVQDLEAKIERLKARVAELESALRGYVKATTGQESATVTFPMALEGERK